MASLQWLNFGVIFITAALEFIFRVIGYERGELPTNTPKTTAREVEVVKVEIFVSSEPEEMKVTVEKNHASTEDKPVNGTQLRFSKGRPNIFDIPSDLISERPCSAISRI